MARLLSSIQTGAAEFRRYYSHNRALVAELRDKQQRARYERPARDVERLARQGKLMPRERLDKLLDPGTPFLEFSTLAANMAYGGEAPSASVITGIGLIQGREVIICAHDASIKGGAWYPLSVKKIVRCLDIAIENRLPVVHLCDSAGGFHPAVGTVSGQAHGRPHLPQPVHPVEDERQTARAGVRALHGGRRLHPGTVGLLGHRAGYGRGVPRRLTIGQSGDRRSRHRGRTRRLRSAHPHQRHLRLPGGERGRGHRHRARNRGAVGSSGEMAIGATRSRNPTTTPTSSTASFPTTSSAVSTCAK